MTIGPILGRETAWECHLVLGMRRPRFGTETWHVFARGSRRLALFYRDSDYLKFLSILEYALQMSGGGLLAWCLMENHYHLVLRATSEQLTACMRRVNHLFSVYHNENHGTTGHTFDGPYRAYRRRGLFFILRTIAYVLLNPVQAGIVRWPGAYRWCSARSFLEAGRDALSVEAAEILRELDPEPGRAKRAFREFLSARMRLPNRKSKATPTAFAVQQEQFRWLIEQANLRKQGSGDPSPEEVAVYWGRQCGIPPRVMSATLDGRDRGLLYKILERLRRRTLKDSDLAARLSLDGG